MIKSILITLICVLISPFILLPYAVYVLIMLAKDGEYVEKRYKPRS